MFLKDRYDDDGLNVVLLNKYSWDLSYGFGETRNCVYKRYIRHFENTISSKTNIKFTPLELTAKSFV